MNVHVTHMNVMTMPLAQTQGEITTAHVMLVIVVMDLIVKVKKL